MSRIFWDTNIFIYLFEGTGRFAERAASLRQRMNERGDQLFTSAMTLGEILVGPIRAGDHATAAQYRRLFANAVSVLPFGEQASVQYARLRATGSLRPPDAIQLACASSVGIDLFVTNDSRLQNQQISGIQFIVPLERVPL
ncbi:MAG TPA: PIN domain-containing protein [Candidatus Acidoferrales bacterium]|nr:PIN domain-containing protein [Candidatus Acidoferrales bacterium]